MTGYREVLRRAHEDLRPRTYFEIGVHYGESILLAQPGTKIVGVDPSPDLRHEMPPLCRIVELTSDDFFDRHTVAEFAGAPADMSFIDGLHRFDFVLRDFRNTERNSAPGGIVFFHDCFPPPDLAVPNRSGDVWKVIVAFRDYRPDLNVRTILSPPSGLGLVSGLDPENSVLFDKYDEILDRYASLSYDDACRCDLPVNPIETNPWAVVRRELPARTFRERSTLDSARAAARRGRLRIRRFTKRNVARVKRKVKNRSA
jgi:hypothetical protein